MATVFMKWLETSPKDYDRGIQILTLGRLTALKKTIADTYITEGMKVLELGCGTGTLAGMMANRGARVIGIDSSPGMLAEAEKLNPSGISEGRVTFALMDATQIADRFPESSFDLIVATLMFSEIPEGDRRFILEACRMLLTPHGRLLIADEAIPIGLFQKLIFYTIRWPLKLITWLLTRTSTNSLSQPDFDTLLAQTGFRTKISHALLGNSLLLYEASPRDAPFYKAHSEIPQLHHKFTLKTILINIWMLFFRLMPPYPKVKPGIYAIGNPDRKSPVLVTGNYKLTVQRVLRALDKKVNAWLLVADSAGINVWCAAGGGFLTAEKIIAAVKSTHLHEIVDHHALILPQLAANGVDGWKIREATGWGVHWGPVKAEDIPQYLATNRKKSDKMRWVSFPLKDRLEMVTVTLTFYALMILIPIAIFWRQNFWPIAISMVGISYFYAVIHPWLPGRDGLWKSIPLTLIVLTGFALFVLLIAPLPIHGIFNWIIGLVALSIFTAAELQGMSPVMRGEQANWGPEAIIFSVLGLTYWLVPLAFGWR